MSESLSRVAQQSLSNLITFQDLIKKFDLDAVPLLTAFVTWQKYNIWTGPWIFDQYTTSLSLWDILIW